MTLQPGTNRQVPDNSILDHYNKQVYLGNKYNYALNFTTTGTSEVAEILLSNPLVTNAAFPNQVALFVDLRALSGLTASSNNVIRSYLNPTVSNIGTVQNPKNLRPASPSVSISSLTSAPTVSSNGTLVETLSVGPFSTQKSDKMIILDPGQSILITIQSISSASVGVELSWYEL